MRPSGNEPPGSPGASRTMTEEETAAAILDISGWLRYAEATAEQRLYSFMMASTLLLLGCATVLASADAPVFLASLLSAAGLILSVLWVIVGRRQSKYHERLGWEVHRLLHAQSAPDKFALKHVQDVEFAPGAGGAEDRLNGAERWLSTRRLMWLVPTLFGGVFAAVLALAALNGG